MYGFWLRSLHFPHTPVPDSCPSAVSFLHLYLFDSVLWGCMFSEFVHLYCHHWEISRERCSHQPGGTTAKGAPSPCPQTAGQVATSLFHRKRGFHPLTQALQRGSYKPAAAITVTTHNLPRSRNGITSYFPNSRNKKWNVYYNTASLKELNAVKKFKYH